MEEAKTRGNEEEDGGISWGMDEDAVEEEGDEQQYVDSLTCLSSMIHLLTCPWLYCLLFSCPQGGG